MTDMSYSSNSLSIPERAQEVMHLAKRALEYKSRIDLDFHRRIGLDSLVSSLHDSATPIILPDVTIKCSDGGDDGVFPSAHKFILSLFSPFFKARFEHDTGDVVDLSNFDPATTEAVKMVLKILYGSETLRDRRTEYEAELFVDLLQLANFLLLPFVAQYCKDQISSCYGSCYTAFLLKVDRLVEECGGCGDDDGDNINNMVLSHLRDLDEEPKDLAESVSFRTMAALLASPESFPMFKRFNSVRALPAIPREKELLSMLVRYIKGDRESRLGKATDLFMLLKLPYLVPLDLASVDLPELEDPEVYPLLHRLMAEAAEVAAMPDITLANPLPSFMWMPRPQSVKYSFFTDSYGHYYYQSDNLLKRKTVTLERGPEHRITAITFYNKNWKDGDGEVIGGMKLRWSDDTEDTVGHVDENLKMEFILSHSDHLQDLQLYMMHRCDHPGGSEFVRRLRFGWRVDSSNSAHRRYIEKDIAPLDDFKQYSNLCYLDGLKCEERSSDDFSEKMITAISFKFSLLLPVEKPFTVTGMPPKWSVANLKEGVTTSMAALKRAFEASERKDPRRWSYSNEDWPISGYSYDGDSD